MPRQRWNPSVCRVCGITKESTPISQRGLCKTCRLERQEANNAQLEDGAGDFYEHWLYRWTLAARRRIVALGAVDAPGEEA